MVMERGETGTVREWMCAIHTSTSTETVFVTGAEIKSHLESTGVKVTILDFSLAAVYVVTLPV